MDPIKQGNANVDKLLLSVLRKITTNERRQRAIKKELKRLKNDAKVFRQQRRALMRQIADQPDPHAIPLREFGELPKGVK